MYNKNDEWKFQKFLLMLSKNTQCLMLYLINGMEIVSSTLITFLFLVPNSRFTPDILDTRKEQCFVLRVEIH